MVACVPLMAVGALLCAAVALWITGGALTVMDRAGDPRMGLLPSPWWLLALVATFAAFGLVASRRLVRLNTFWISRMKVFWISAVVFLPWLPWLPFDIPRAFFLWVGPLSIAIWIAIAIVLLAPLRHRILPGSPRGATAAAGILAACVYLFAARQTAPRLPSGDEPHYLIIAQSLLSDHDLKIENNHQRGDYREYWRGALRPDYLNRGRNGAIYSVHAPGLPAIVAPAFAAFGYSGVTVFLAIVSALGSALAWRVAWEVSGDAPASWFAWAGVALSAPMVFQSFVVYPDALAAALILVGVHALSRGTSASPRMLLGAGVALSLLPWLHTRLVLAAATIGLLIVLRNLKHDRWRARLATFLTIPVIGAICWFAFFFAVYGTPDPRAPYGGSSQSSFANLLAGVIGLLFDQQFGILPNAPVYLLAISGFGQLAGVNRRLAIELALIVIPYAVAVAAFQMWWGGLSSPARFLVPILWTLVIPIAVSVRESKSAPMRVTAVGSLMVSLMITAALSTVDRGALVYNTRDGAARLLLWAAPLVNATLAFPSVFRDRPATALLQSMVWVLAILAILAAGHATMKRWRSLTATMIVMAIVGAVGVMAAASGVWYLNRADPLMPFPAGVDLLAKYRDDSGQWLIAYSPLRRLPLLDAPRLVSLPIGAPGRDARRIRHYGPATVIWVDGEAELERPGAWVFGRARATFLVEPESADVATLYLRNVPAANRVTVRSSAFSVEIPMRPAEERTIALRGARTLVAIETASGARPSDFEPGSRDRRLLGCWLEIR